MPPISSTSMTATPKNVGKGRLRPSIILPPRFAGPFASLANPWTTESRPTSPNTPIRAYLTPSRTNSLYSLKSAPLAIPPFLASSKL